MVVVPRVHRKPSSATSPKEEVEIVSGWLDQPDVGTEPICDLLIYDLPIANKYNKIGKLLNHNRKSPLTLFMFGVFADHPDHSTAADDLALITNLFYRCTYLHKPTLLILN